MSFSKNIVELRKARGWSQEAFAKKLNVSPQAISDWENGTALPDTLDMLLVSKLFDVTTDDLLKDDESGAELPAVQTEAREIKKRRHLSAGFAFAASAICWLIVAVNSKNDLLTVLSCLTFGLSAGNAIAQFVLYSRKP